jgi:uncharacterized phage protein (TIGR01671 family)
MNNLEFRVFDKRYGRFWDGTGLDLIDDSVNLFLEPRGQLVVMNNDPYWSNMTDEEIRERFVVSQWTGLKDKNGVKIFDGDVVKRRKLTDSGGYFHYFNSAVEVVDGVINGVGVIVEWDRETNKTDVAYLGEHCEVVGNIYENPWLIK